jgi:DNA-directed RNA polymerase specialized sigma24 family protein
MSNNEIINKYYNCPKLNKAINNISKNSPLTEDLKQELMLIILEYSNEKLNKIIEGKYFHFFCVRILTNLFNSKSSHFYRKYKQHEFELIDGGFDVYQHNISNEDNVERKDIEDIKEIIIELLEDNSFSWYDREIFLLYLNTHKSYAKLSKELNIPITSISTTISKTKRQLSYLIEKRKINK